MALLFILYASSPTSPLSHCKMAQAMCRTATVCPEDLSSPPVTQLTNDQSPAPLVIRRRRHPTSVLVNR